MATVVSTMFLASCADDVYDPSKEPQATPTENPPDFITFLRHYIAHIGNQHVM